MQSSKQSKFEDRDKEEFNRLLDDLDNTNAHHEDEVEEESKATDDKQDKKAAIFDIMN